jgi:hypothetical protein
MNSRAPKPMVILRPKERVTLAANSEESMPARKKLEVKIWIVGLSYVQ